MPEEIPERIAVALREQIAKMFGCEAYQVKVLGDVFTQTVVLNIHSNMMVELDGFRVIIYPKGLDEFKMSIWKALPESFVRQIFDKHKLCASKDRFSEHIVVDVVDTIREKRPVFLNLARSLKEAIDELKSEFDEICISVIESFTEEEIERRIAATKIANELKEG